MIYNIEMEEKEEIRWRFCNKKIALKDKGKNTSGIYFWCNRCKKEIEIKN